MIAHIVLLQPRADLTEAQRADALAALKDTAKGVPEIRAIRLGRRIKHGLPGYEQLMRLDYEYALIIEVDDVETLKRYLQAPEHKALGELFHRATSEALAYDYAFESVGF